MTEFLNYHETTGGSRLGRVAGRILGSLGLSGERVLVLNNNDWPSEIPGPEMSKEEFYDVLARVPEVYDQAMEDLRKGR
jgi:hypothetical protein